MVANVPMKQDDQFNAAKCEATCTIVLLGLTVLAPARDRIASRRARVDGRGWSILSCAGR